MTDAINSASILPSRDLDDLRAVLIKAREFISEEIQVRENSFDSDEPEHSLYIAPGRALLTEIDEVLAKVTPEPRE